MKLVPLVRKLTTLSLIRRNRGLAVPCYQALVSMAFMSRASECGPVVVLR
jgi:hypothetical protein